MRMTKEAIQSEALARAAGGGSAANYAAIISGFMAKGIAAADISPRENVFTFNAWRALGRSVKRGEKGVKCITWIQRNRPAADDAGGDGAKRRGGMFPRMVTVFHISQTIELMPAAQVAPAAAAIAA